MSDIWTKGTILIVDFPIDTWAESAKIIQRLMKRVFFRELSARVPANNMRPVLAIFDEAQHLVELDGSVDELFLSNSRSKGCVPLYLTQSIDALHAQAGGGPRAAHLVNAFTANLVTKLMVHCSGTTAEWCSNLIGKQYSYLGHASGTAGNGAMNQGQGGGSESLQPILLSTSFHDLKTGGPCNVVDAYCFRGGKPFSNGQPVAKVAFPLPPQ